MIKRYKNTSLVDLSDTHVELPSQVTRYSSQLNRSVEIYKQDVEGCMYGIAVGDARGLPFETLDSQAIKDIMDAQQVAYFPTSSNKYLSEENHPKGQVSDDLHLTLAVMRAVINGMNENHVLSMDQVGKEHVRALQRNPVGWGGSTRKSVEAFASGVPWHEAGEINSGTDKGLGNGIPMKIAAIGIYAALKDMTDEKLEIVVRDISLMSHPKSMAISAGLAHANAIRYCLSTSPEDFSRNQFIEIVITASERGKQYLPNTLITDDLTKQLNKLRDWENYNTERISEEFGGGACYVYHSLPFSYMHFLQDPFDFKTLDQTIRAGGDTDSNAAIVGGLLGALHGKDFIPRELINGLQDLDDLDRTLDIFWKKFA